MRSALAALASLALAACDGRSSDQRAKLSPAQQCVRMIEQLRACEPTLARAYQQGLAGAGVPKGELADYGFDLGDPSRCEDTAVVAATVPQYTACYHRDCDRFAACLVPRMREAQLPTSSR